MVYARNYFRGCAPKRDNYSSRNGDESQDVVEESKSAEDEISSSKCSKLTARDRALDLQIADTRLNRDGEQPRG